MINIPLKVTLAMILAGTVHAEDARFALRVTGTSHWTLSVDREGLSGGAKLTLLDAREHGVGVLDSTTSRVTLPGPGVYHAILAPREAGTHVAVAITNQGEQVPCAAFRFTALPEGISRIRMMSSCVFQVHHAAIEGSRDRRWTLALADEVHCQVAPRMAVPVMR